MTLEPIESRAHDLCLVEKLLGAITYREALILGASFMGGETLGEIAKAHGVSRGRVGQIRDDAVRKMRSRARRLGAVR